MKEYNNRKRCCGGSGDGGRNEETKPKVACGIHNDVRGRDVVDGFGIRVGRHFPVNEAEEAAVDGAIGTISLMAERMEVEKRTFHGRRGLVSEAMVAITL
jgi:hypothetical protein